MMQGFPEMVEYIARLLAAWELTEEDRQNNIKQGEIFALFITAPDQVDYFPCRVIGRC